MENEKLDLQVGDLVTFKNKEDGASFVDIMTRETIGNYYKQYFQNELEILKIERPKYEVVEEKKELLTDEEREYLKNIIKPLRYKSLKIRKTIDDYIEISIDSEECFSTDEISLSYIKNLENLKFENLEKGRNYNLKELGLEEL